MPPARDFYRTRWFLWSLGVLLLAVAGGAVIAVVGGDEGPTPQERARAALKTTRHTITYEVTSPGKTPSMITYRADGINNDKSVSSAKLPWKKQVTLKVGPGPAVAQVMATGGEAASTSCSIRVDGEIVVSRTAKGQYMDVSCSTVVQPDPS